MNATWTLIPTDDRKPYRAGQQRRLSTGSARVISVQHTTLGELDHDTARRLGHKGTAAFKRWWLAERDRDWLAADLRGEGEQMARFDTRWAHHQVVLLSYVFVEAPVYLARSGSGTDYTSSPSRAIRDAGAVLPADERHVAKARRESITLRQSFQDELEAERARRKAERRPWLKAS